MLPERIPHPVKDFATAIANGARICQPRGYCGPFINGHIYDTFPDPVWHGIGECVHCRNTVQRQREEAKMALALRGYRDIREPVTTHGVKRPPQLAATRPDERSV